jgi:drug/metabolite transporter (DMT)-like permease
LALPPVAAKLSGMPVLVLVVAVFAVSLSAPLIRLSAADALTIATWRVGISMLLISAIVGTTGGWRQWARLTRRDLAIGLGAGALLALHFWSWNQSVQLTTVAAAVVLVNTQPVVVAALSVLLLGEKPTRRQWTGIAVALVGAATIAAPDLRAAGGDSVRGEALLGDVLALLGAVTVAGYYVAGRHLRATLDLWPYVALVYGTCFLVLLLLSLATGAQLTGQPPREIAIFAALAAGPMLLGHTGLNYALKYAPAYLVNLPLLGEPVIATALAAALPSVAEIPTAMTMVGGSIVLAGVLLAARR